MYDAVKEADGDKIIRSWKLLLILGSNLLMDLSGTPQSKAKGDNL